MCGHTRALILSLSKFKKKKGEFYAQLSSLHTRALIFFVFLGGERRILRAAVFK